VGVTVMCKSEVLKCCVRGWLTDGGGEMIDDNASNSHPITNLL
jgi:hypothetical protein